MGGTINFAWMILLSILLVHFFQCTFQIIQMKRSRLLITDSEMTFEKALKDDDMLNEFERYLVFEYSSENLQFLRKVMAFESRFYNISTDYQVKNAKKIIKEHVGYSAELPVNISV